MGMDWENFLKGQVQAAQPQESSAFPQTPWSSLAQILHMVGVAMTVPKAHAQSQYQQGEAEAKQFGLPGLRAFYADPKTQQLAQTANIPMPSLPPLSAEEMKNQRYIDFYTAINKARESVKGKTIPGAETITGKKGEEAVAIGPEQILPPTAADYQKAMQPVIEQYRDVAQAEGFTPKSSATAMGALYRAVASNSDPSAVRLTIALWMKENGLSWDTLDDYTKQAIANIQNPLYEANVDKAHAAARASISASALNDTKKAELLKQSDAKLADIKAHTKELVDKGLLDEAEAYYKTETAKMVQPLAEATIAEKNAIAIKDKAVADAQAHDNNYKDALAQYNQAKTTALKAGNDSAGGVKLAVANLKAQSDRGARMIASINTRENNIQLTNPELIPGLEKQKEDLQNEINTANQQAADLLSGRLKPSQLGGGASHVDPSTTTPPAAPEVDNAFNATMNIVKNAKTPMAPKDVILNSWAAWKKNPKTQNWSRENWDALWNKLTAWAKSRGMTEDIPEPGG